MKKQTAGNILPVIFLFFLFFPVFYSDYAFTDEAFQLWHRKEAANYNMFFLQGRWITGIMIENFFGKISTIGGLKILRIFSFFSWAIFLFAFMNLSRQWQKYIKIDPLLLVLTGVFIACSPSVAIYIGWGSCFEIGIASILALLSGHFLFMELMKQDQSVHISNFKILLILLAGLGSLFMYQTTFALFLFPFFCYVISGQEKNFKRIVSFGVIAYIVINVIYYLVFLYSLKYANAAASDRTEISKDVLGKLSFFFSIPLSQAFSFNVLYNLHNVLSQAFPVLMIAAWVCTFFFLQKAKLKRAIYLLLLVLLLMLMMYAPVLVSKENFASYRTMFALNLAITFLLLQTIFRLLHSQKAKQLFCMIASVCFIVIGSWNFYFNFNKPLRFEYEKLRQYVFDNYNEKIKTIYFLRPDENLFYKKFHVNTFRDEFGEPSTFKDWTPEPLIRQLILEKMQDDTHANNIIIKQFTEKEIFEKEKNSSDQSVLCIAMESLF
jgi:hypothetical protein